MRKKNIAQGLEALKFKKITHVFSYLWNFNFQVGRLPYPVLPMYYNQRISMYLSHTDYQVGSFVCVFWWVFFKGKILFVFTSVLVCCHFQAFYIK